MNFSSLMTAGTITGVLSFAGAISAAFGKPALGAFLSDPATAATATSVVSGALGLIAGALKGFEASAPEAKP